MNIELWKKRKKELKLTYDKLAEISGISRRTIAGIFGGDSNYQSPTFNTVQAIERALGLSSDITPEEYAAGWRNTATMQITPDEDDLLDRYKEIKQILGEKKGADLVKSLLDNLINSLK